MTKIEWTQKTWNPIIGCTKISTGCNNCYAEKFAHRLANIQKTQRYGFVLDNKGKWNGRTEIDNDMLLKPLHWRKPAMIFVCSMGDLFHESVPFEWIDKVFDIIYKCPQHTFQILTKRPEIAKQYCDYNHNQIAENIFWGTTIENQNNIKRIEDLLRIQAKIHFISAEPLLSNLDLSYYLPIKSYSSCPENKKEFYNIHRSIDWLIAGPETGPGKRPMQKEWIESLYDQCKVANVPFFDKKNILGLNLQQYPI